MSPGPTQQLYERAAAALLSLTTLFIAWTLVVPVVAALAGRGSLGDARLLRSLAISLVLASVGLAGVWLLRRRAARLAPREPAEVDPERHPERPRD